MNITAVVDCGKIRKRTNREFSPSSEVRFNKAQNLGEACNTQQHQIPQKGTNLSDFF